MSFRDKLQVLFPDHSLQRKPGEVWSVRPNRVKDVYTGENFDFEKENRPVIITRSYELKSRVRIVPCTSKDLLTRKPDRTIIVSPAEYPFFQKRTAILCNYRQQLNFRDLVEYSGSISELHFEEIRKIIKKWFG